MSLTDDLTLAFHRARQAQLAEDRPDYFAAIRPSDFADIASAMQRNGWFQRDHVSDDGHAILVGEDFAEINAVKKVTVSGDGAKTQAALWGAILAQHTGWRPT